MQKLPTEREMDLKPEEKGYLIYVFTVIKPGETEKEVVRTAAPDWQQSIRMMMKLWPGLEVVSFDGYMNPHVDGATA